MRYWARWSRFCRREPFVFRACFETILPSRLFRSWIVALIPRPLTRTALSPSVAAMIVLTPRSMPIVGPGGRGSTMTSQTISTAS
jgi:hypothetical protein